MSTFNKIIRNAAASALSLGALSAMAADHMTPGMGMEKPMVSASGVGSAMAVMSDGVIRKIDKDAKKLTIKHGEIVNLQMPGMTMVFQVKNAALLDKVQVGDKVKFHAEKQDGAIVVTDVQVAP